MGQTCCWLSQRPQYYESGPPPVYAQPQHVQGTAVALPVAAAAIPVGVAGMPVAGHAVGGVAVGQPVPAYGQPAYGQPMYGQPLYAQPGYGGYMPPQHVHGGHGVSTGAAVGGALAAGAVGVAAGALVGAALAGGDDHHHYSSSETVNIINVNQTTVTGPTEIDVYGGMQAGAGRDNPPDGGDDDAATAVREKRPERRRREVQQEFKEPRWHRQRGRRPEAKATTRELAASLRDKLAFIEFYAHIWAPQHLQKMASQDTVTIVTQCSVDRLPRLQAMAASWSGSISCAIHVPTDQEAAAAAIASINHMYQTISQTCPASLSIVLYQEPAQGKGDERAAWAVPLYPINALRNAALQAATTEYIFLLDIDFVAAPGAHSAIRAWLAEQQGVASKKALVIPAIEVRQGVPLPNSRDEVARLMRAGDAEGFHTTRYPKGHLPTQFEKWLSLAQGEEYSVRYSLGFEPYIVARRSQVPRYDARFRGYGLNKVVHLYRMAAVDSFDFVVATEDFVAAPEHKASIDYQRTYGDQSDPLQAARIQALFDMAVEEMHSKVSHHSEHGTSLVSRPLAPAIPPEVLQHCAQLSVFTVVSTAVFLLGSIMTLGMEIKRLRSKYEEGNAKEGQQKEKREDDEVVEHFWSLGLWLDWERPATTQKPEQDVAAAERVD